MALPDHEAYMRLALDEARLAKASGEVPVGAVIVHDGQVIAACRNMRENTLDPTAHAEMLALREAARVLSARRLSGCTLYVTLEPCPMCAGAIVMAQVDACFFAAFDARQGCCGSVYDIPRDPAFSHSTRIVGGILMEEAQALLQEFFSTRRT
jgi:tRNA(adenine34) deaminase